MVFGFYLQAERLLLRRLPDTPKLALPPQKDELLPPAQIVTAVAQLLNATPPIASA